MPANIHVMLDLETLGTSHNSVILAIGAVKFDPLADGVLDKFYVRVNPATHADFGAKIDAGTVMWWLHPDRAAAREALLASDAVDIGSALFGFSSWFGDDPLPVWGNGARMDNELLDNAYAATGLKSPWSYKADRCFRTFRALAPDVTVAPVGTAHQALDDAEYQALTLQAIVKHLGIPSVQ